MSDSTSRQSHDSLTTRELRIVDAHGRDRCVISSITGTPFVHLMDDQGRPRLVLHLGPDGEPNVSLFSAQNTLLMNLSWASLWFVTESGANHIQLGLHETEGFVFEAQLNQAAAGNRPKAKARKNPARKKRKR